MNKISHIISREFLTRVKSKQFLISTFLGPVFMSLIIFVPVLIAKYSDNKQQIWVIDESGIFNNKLKGNEEIHFLFTENNQIAIKDSIKANDESGLLIIPKTFSVEKPEGISYLGTNALSIQSMSFVEHAIEKEVKNLRLERSGISQSLIDSLNTNISIKTL